MYSINPDKTDISFNYILKGRKKNLSDHLKVKKK